MKLLSPSATISNMFDIIALEKGPICASNELSRLVIAQCKPGFKEDLRIRKKGNEEKRREEKDSRKIIAKCDHKFS